MNELYIAMIVTTKKNIPAKPCLLNMYKKVNITLLQSSKVIIISYLSVVILFLSCINPYYKAFADNVPQQAIETVSELGERVYIGAYQAGVSIPEYVNGLMAEYGMSEEAAQQAIQAGLTLENYEQSLIQAGEITGADIEAQINTMVGTERQALVANLEALGILVADVAFTDLANYSEAYTINQLASGEMPPGIVYMVNGQPYFKSATRPAFTKAEFAIDMETYNKYQKQYADNPYTIDKVMDSCFGFLSGTKDTIGRITQDISNWIIHIGDDTKEYTKNLIDSFYDYLNGVQNFNGVQTGSDGTTLALTINQDGKIVNYKITKDQLKMYHEGTGRIIHFSGYNKDYYGKNNGKVDSFYWVYKNGSTYSYTFLGSATTDYPGSGSRNGSFSLFMGAYAFSFEQYPRGIVDYIASLNGFNNLHDHYGKHPGLTKTPQYGTPQKIGTGVFNAGDLQNAPAGKLPDSIPAENPITNPEVSPPIADIPYNPPVIAPGDIPGKPIDDNPIENPDPEDIPGVEPGDEPGLVFTDLSNFFPFCIPGDILAAISMLKAEPVEPKWEIPIKISYSDYTLVDYIMVIDLTAYGFSSLFSVIRTIEVIIFCIGLGLATRRFIY